MIREFLSTVGLFLASLVGLSPETTTAPLVTPSAMIVQTAGPTEGFPVELFQADVSAGPGVLGTTTSTEATLTVAAADAITRAELDAAFRSLRSEFLAITAAGLATAPAGTPGVSSQLFRLQVDRIYDSVARSISNLDKSFATRLSNLTIADLPDLSSSYLSVEGGVLTGSLRIGNTTYASNSVRGFASTSQLYLAGGSSSCGGCGADGAYIGILGNATWAPGSVDISISHPSKVPPAADPTFSVYVQDSWEPLIVAYARSKRVTLGEGSNIAVVVGASSTPYAKFAVVGSKAASTTMALRPATAQTARILDIYRPSGALDSVITASGNWGISSTSPWRTLSVTGTVGFDGLGSTGGTQTLCLSANKEVVTNNGECVSSSEQLKDDIQTISLSATDMVSAMRPVSFNYLDADRPTYGFIAEDVAAIDNRFIGYFDQLGSPRTINTTSILAVTVKAVQELANRIAALFNTTERHDAELELLRTRVSELEARTQIAAPPPYPPPLPADTEAVDEAEGEEVDGEAEPAADAVPSVPLSEDQSSPLVE